MAEERALLQRDEGTPIDDKPIKPISPYWDIPPVSIEYDRFKREFYFETAKTYEILNSFKIPEICFGQVSHDQSSYQEGVDLFQDINVKVELGNNCQTKLLKTWAKVVSGLEGHWSGASLVGDFLRKINWTDKQGIFIGKAVAGVPVVVGTTYINKDSPEQAPAHIAFVGAYEQNRVLSIKEKLGTGGDEIVISGNFSKKHNNVYQTTPGQRPNAYGEAAEYISKHLPAFEKPMAEYKRISDAAGVEFTKDTLEFKPEQSITYNGKKLTLPPGYLFLHQINGIWLIGRQIKNGKEIVFCDGLADLAPSLDANLIEFINDQSKKLEALAMTYKIIAMSI